MNLTIEKVDNKIPISKGNSYRGPAFHNNLL